MTDLELMKLLEDEGYEATLENLQTLKEGIERGEYYIKDATEDRNPEELTSDIDNEDVYNNEEHEQEEDVGEVVVESLSDYELYKLLESEGYETTDENLEILKEGLYSGEIEILDETANEIRRIYKDLSKSIQQKDENGRKIPAGLDIISTDGYKKLPKSKRNLVMAHAYGKEKAVIVAHDKKYKDDNILGSSIKSIKQQGKSLEKQDK